MKMRFSIIGLLFFSTFSFAQKSVNVSGIDIQTKPLHCSVPAEGYEADLIQLSITNNTNQVKTVSYSFELYYDGVCANCEHPEMTFTQVLQPKSKLEGVCLDRERQGLTIFDHMPAHLTKTQLTDYKILNVKVQ
ncbi:MAG: hypothetical protein RLZZ65_943 [Bacteroidota bacterium]|jgi:hypothetical protein